MAVRRVFSGRAYRCPVCGSEGSGYDCRRCDVERAKRAQFAAKVKPASLLDLLTDEPRRRK